MRRKAALLLLFALLLPGFAVSDETSQLTLYTGQLRESVAVLSEPDMVATRLGYVAAGKSLEILGIDPAWLLIRYNGKLTGYIKRSSMDDISVKALDPSGTPHYAMVPCEWLAWIKEEAHVLAAPEPDAESLITLREGARLSLVDIRDGWGRVIYHRQYGYIDTRHFSEIQPVNRAEAPGSDAPLAAYTSFYKITTDESNLNRIINLQVACDRFGQYTLQNGDILDFNEQIGPYSRTNGYLPANALVRGEVVQSYGGGTCQVSSTLYNVILQLPGIAIIKRRAHGPAAASYLPHGADAAVGSTTQNFIIQNLYPYPVRIDGTVQDGALTIAAYRAD